LAPLAESGLNVVQNDPVSFPEEFLKGDRSGAAGYVVLELQIPGSSGLELQELLAQAEDPLPVIFLTAHGNVSSSVHAMKQGAVDFLTKPVRGDELFEAVRRAPAWSAAERQTRRQKREWRARYERLTLREREVFGLVVGSLSNKQRHRDQDRRRSVTANRLERITSLITRPHRSE
jgi:FixJ family two-component response regulator